jgi:hypothetical protein
VQGMVAEEIIMLVHVALGQTRMPFPTTCDKIILRMILHVDFTMGLTHSWSRCCQNPDPKTIKVNQQLVNSIKVVALLKVHTTTTTTTIMAIFTTTFVINIQINSSHNISIKINQIHRINWLPTI